MVLCKQCKNEFVSLNPRRMYCSGSCKHAAYYDKNKRVGTGCCVQCGNAIRHEKSFKYCSKECKEKAHYKRWGATSLERQKEYRQTPRGRAHHLYKSARQRAKKLRLEFDLTREWLEERLIYGRCEMSGLEFGYGVDARKHPYAPSLDRIDNDKGYTQDNCRVILWALNTALSWWGEDEFRGIAEAWLDSIKMMKVSGGGL